MKKATERLKALDHRYVWHPFTQMQEWTADTALVIEEGRGAYLKDTDGRWYLDGTSSLWVNVHGHRVPEIDRAVKKQIDRVAHSTLLGLANVPSILLAAELARIAPGGLTKVFYSDSGSTAVEVALKMSYQYWKQRGEKRNAFIKFENAYHGDTVGSVSVGGISLFHDLFKPLLFNTLEAPWPHTYWRPSGVPLRDWRDQCLERLEQLLRENHAKTAAVIIEPLIQGAAGMASAPSGFLKGVARLCRKYRVLLIVDEVATGFGRTGRMFACEWEGVRPDLLCVAKGLTGGYLPLAATLSTATVFKGFLGTYPEFKTFFHGHSYTGNPLACAAALANLELFRRKRTLQKLTPKIEILKQALKPLAKLPHVGDIRQKGFMAGIELMLDADRMRPFPPEARIGARVCAEARCQGVLLRPLGNVVVLMPPLILSAKEIRQMIQVVARAITCVTGNRGSTSPRKGVPHVAE